MHRPNGNLSDTLKKRLRGSARTSRTRRRRRIALLIVFSPAIVCLGIIANIWGSTKDLVHTQVADVSNEPVAIVFGAGVLPSGKPSLILQGRLDGAIALYKQGKASRLLMSGDNRTKYYNEPKAMRTYALNHGVRDKDLILDFAGRDTYDTCYRAKHHFGVDRAVFVTQAYHAPRALYIGRTMGIDAEALAVPNLDQYPGLQANYTSRECLAEIKAWWEVHISHRKPYVNQGK